MERQTIAAAPGSHPDATASDENPLPVAANPRHQGKKLCDIEAAAERFGCTPRLIRKFVAERRVPVVRVGRLIRFRDEDLDAFEEACRQAATRGPLAESHQVG